MKRLPHCAALLGAQLLAACTSAPTHYYTLSASATPADPANGLTRGVVINNASIPDLVDRMQLVVRQSPTRVSIVETQQWAQPLRDQIAEVLVRDLRLQLGSSNIAGDARLVSGSSPLKVVLKIEQFDASPASSVELRARWSISGETDTKPLIDGLSLSQPLSGDGYDAIVEGWSQALAKLSAALAADLRTAASP